MRRQTRLTPGQQQLHSAGTCPHCEGRGTQVLRGVPLLHVLPCGPCAGSGSSR